MAFTHDDQLIAVCFPDTHLAPLASLASFPETPQVLFATASVIPHIQGCGSETIETHHNLNRAKSDGAINLSARRLD